MGEDRQFAAVGGDAEHEAEAPAKFAMTDENKETFEYLLHVNDELYDMLDDDTATLQHMMNTNTFSSAFAKLKDTSKAEEFAEDYKAEIQGQHWMCGFPDKVVVISVADYVMMAYGAEECVDDLVEPARKWHRIPLFWWMHRLYLIRRNLCFFEHTIFILVSAGVLILYAAAPGSLKNTVLLLSSLFFYGWGEPRYVIWMMLAILMAYIFGLLIERYQSVPKLARLFLALSVSSSLLMLGYFKYADFFIRNVNAVTGCSISLLNITLPIGISFYTFQILSYTVDIYRQDVKAQRNPIDLATYVALFPQLIAGPIVRYSDIAEQLKGRIHTMGKTAQGIRRFILGLGKKILIANLLGELCSIFRASDDKSVLFFWLYAVAYTLHVYFDFSGYSDMAIGLESYLDLIFWKILIILLSRKV